jgi:hypothetical protein
VAQIAPALAQAAQAAAERVERRVTTEVLPRVARAAAEDAVGPLLDACVGERVRAEVESAKQGLVSEVSLMRRAVDESVVTALRSQREAVEDVIARWRVDAAALLESRVDSGVRAQLLREFSAWHAALDRHLQVATDSGESLATTPLPERLALTLAHLGA